ncbi:hypothetical protein DPMN_139813 [Dreissena polymorpha]|uniref:DEAD/DEAH-box helicase domain-containing protein n=1 Tax=Dreissena polymorpha TaxID=45954 RepID=A0A9D4G6K4_DREPO|nr:hypothetical protein DPMN_139813 [Dreissena polymorpha]
MEKLDAGVRCYDEKLILKDKQREALMQIANRKGDIIVNLQVGYGKSIIYHLLPKVLGENVNKPVVLVVSSLNVIQKDQCVSLRKHNISSCRLDISANVDDGREFEQDGEINGHLYKCKTDANIDHLIQGDFSVILCHPEALLNTHKGREILKSQLQQHVVAVVIDECHILDKWYVSSGYTTWLLCFLIQ